MLSINGFFSDGYTTTSTNADHQFAENGYPYTVTLYLYSDCCETSVSQIVNKPPCNAEFKWRFSNEIAGGISLGNKVHFYAQNPSNDVTYTWDFGDGTTGSGKYVVHKYDVSSYDSYIVTLTVTAKDGSCSKSKINKIYISCGHVYAVNSGTTNYDDNWKLVGKIWCKNNLIYETVGANSKTYHKFGGVGPWIHSTDAILKVNLYGDFLNVINDECVQANINISDEGLKKTAEVLAEDHVFVKKPRFFDNRLKSLHQVSLSNEILGKIDLYLKN